MADAGVVHGEVLSQWPQMFRVLNTFLSSRGVGSDQDDKVPETDSESHGERLVRVPIEDLQVAEH